MDVNPGRLSRGSRMSFLQFDSSVDDSSGETDARDSLR